ncbi:MAG TPA: hypothetical protein VJJ24_02215 [Candidatus Paceibacterota bacterium]
MKIVVTLILIVVAVVVFVVPIRSLLDGAKPLEAESVALNEALNNAIRIRAERDKLNAQYSAFDINDKDKLNKLLPSHVDSVRLILEINNIARLHNMQINNVKINAIENSRPDSSGQIVPATITSNKFAFMTLTFAVESDYLSFKAFLDDLEKSLRIADVTSLAFSSDKGTTNTYGVAIKTYWLNNPPKP